MNRTILKLFTKACYHGDYEPENVPKEVVEKFAELLVRECAEVADCNAHVSGWELGDKIKQHFGLRPQP